MWIPGSTTLMTAQRDPARCDLEHLLRPPDGTLPDRDMYEDTDIRRIKMMRMV